jgi:hypothetical protein
MKGGEAEFTGNILARRSEELLISNFNRKEAYDER